MKDIVGDELEFDNRFPDELELKDPLIFTGDWN